MRRKINEKEEKRKPMLEKQNHPKKKLDPYPVTTCPKKPSNSADLRALKYQKDFSTPPAPREKKKKKRGDGGGG